MVNNGVLARPIGRPVAAPTVWFFAEQLLRLASLF
jgi:hypothetical protein